jgi:hypothetical protein
MLQNFTPSVLHPVRSAVRAEVPGRAASYRSLTPAVNLPGPFCIMASRNFSRISQYLSLLFVLVGEIHTAGDLHNPKTRSPLFSLQKTRF